MIHKCISKVCRGSSTYLLLVIPKTIEKALDIKDGDNVEFCGSYSNISIKKVPNNKIVGEEK